MTMTTAESQAPPPAIGIDLGTTYSCAAVWRKDRVEIIPNDQGNLITPSCVSFRNCKRLFVGDSAVSAAASNPTNTVVDVKRLMGRRFSDPSVQMDMMLWPFKVVSGQDDKPMIAITAADEEKQFSAEDISAMILTKMKEIAEAYLGSSVADAVVTVPAHFSHSQRRATREAGVLSGLNVLRIISEPTAAAIAYSLRMDPPVDGERNVLVFDLGGGTLDVSLLTMREGDVRVKAIAGDTQLGGEDFDYRMVNYFVEELKRTHNRDISAAPRALRRLKAACERAKRSLSFAGRTVIEIDALHDGFDFEYELSRAEFEALNVDLFENCIRHVESCLKDAEVDKSSVHDVVLAGGSTRIPMVRRLLRDFFDGKELCTSAHPDEAVAAGAAIQAWAISSGQRGHWAVEDPTFRDVTPLSLGVGVRGGRIHVVIPKNTAFPTKVEKVLQTSADNETIIAFEFYVGEGVRAQDNACLGNLTLDNIPRAPRGVEKFDVCFEIDADGFLDVSVVVRSTGERRSLEIGYVDLPKHEVDCMLEYAERCRSEDKRHRRRLKAERSLVRYVYKTRDTVLGKTGAPFMLPDRATEKIRKEIESSIEWLEANESAEAKVLSKKRKELESKWNPFLDALSSLITY